MSTPPGPATGKKAQFKTVRKQHSDTTATNPTPTKARNHPHPKPRSKSAYHLTRPRDHRDDSPKARPTKNLTNARVVVNERGALHAPAINKMVVSPWGHYTEQILVVSAKCSEDKQYLDYKDRRNQPNIAERLKALEAAAAQRPNNAEKSSDLTTVSSEPSPPKLPPRTRDQIKAAAAVLHPNGQDPKARQKSTPKRSTSKCKLRKLLCWIT